MGLGSLLLFFPFLFLQSKSFNQTILEISILLLWVGNWPHFSSTLHRLYSDPRSRNDYPTTYYVLPVLFLGFVSAGLTYPHSFGSLFIKIYTLWAPYHFSGQTLGLALLYARRGNIRVEGKERYWLSMLIFSTFFVLVGTGESALWEQKLYGISFYSLDLPLFTRWIAWFLFGTSLVAFSIAHVRASRGRGSFPVIAWIPVIAQSVWFLVGPRIEAFYQLVPFFHSIQYLPVIWLLHIQKNPGHVGRETFRWARVNFVGGAFLFWAIPILLVFFRYDYGVARAIVFTAVNLHHFVIDGVIWKLRRANVSLPLMGSATAASV